MADRTLDELRVFFNSQVGIQVADRDWALTKGEMNTMAAFLKAVLMRQALVGNPDEPDESYIRACTWAGRLGLNCPGFKEYVRGHASEIAAEADEMTRKAEEKRATTA